MNFNQFVERIKTAGNINPSVDDKNKPVIFISWILQTQIEPNFKEFDDIVFLFRSDVNVLRYNQLKQFLIRSEVDQNSLSHKGGLPQYIAIKKCYLEDMYRVFIKCCFITAKCSMITGTKYDGKKIDRVCGERAITTVQNEPVCRKCLEKFKKIDRDLLDDMEDDNEILPIERLSVGIIPPRIILTNPRDLDKFKVVVSKVDEDEDETKDEATVIREKSILDQTSLKNLKDQGSRVIEEVKKLTSTKTISLSFVLSLEEIEALKNPEKATQEVLNVCVEKGYLTTALRYLPLGRVLSDKIKSDEAIEALSSLSQREE
jgi:hypothetical protein